MELTKGQAIKVRTAYGDRVPMRVVGGPELGHDFEIVWVCTDDDYNASHGNPSEEDLIPWPTSAIEDVPEPV